MPTPQSQQQPRRQRFERLEARISTEQKALFRKAASLEGQTLTDFIIRCVAQEARRVIQENEVLALSERDRKVFVQALLNPPAPNAALRKAVKNHERVTGENR